MPLRPHELIIDMAGGPNDEVILDDLAGLCASIKQCLSSIESDLTGKKAKADFLVTDLQLASAHISLVPKSGRIAAEAAHVFAMTLGNISLDREIDPRVSYQSLQKIESLCTKPSGKDSRVSVNGLPLDKSFLVRLEKFLDAPTKSLGTVSGWLEHLNVHQKLRFSIYEPFDNNRIEFTFPEQLLEDVRAAVKQFVTVTGTLYYSTKRADPIKGEADSIEIHPHDEDLPNHLALKGILPTEIDGIKIDQLIKIYRDNDLQGDIVK